MKLRSFLWAVTLSAVSAFSGMAWAQDTGTGQGTTAGPETGAGAGERGRLDYLTADEKTHLMRVRRQVMAGNPELKTEQESLKKEWKDVRGEGTAASADDKEKLRADFKAHNEKMNAAMLQADPSVQPILDKVKVHRHERFQGQAGGAGAGDDSNDE